MRLLLDTHAFMWANVDPDRLGPWRSTVEDMANELLLSAASSWELAIKAAIGRLVLPEPVASYVPSRMSALGITGVSVDHRHALAVAALPMHHGDPFDRLLIAQARLLGVPILTADASFEAYDVEVLRLPLRSVGPVRRRRVNGNNRDADHQIRGNAADCRDR